METGERAEPDTTATCIVVRPLGAAPPPPPLIAALSARGFRTVHCDDVYEALARLCACVADHHAPAQGVSLVVIDRSGVGEIDEFLEAIETYVPSVVPWDFDDSHGLRPLVIEQSQPDEPEPPVPEPTSEASRYVAPPQLKLSQDFTPQDIAPHTSDSSDDEPDADDDPTMSQLLTDEELSMLLDDEPPSSTEAGDRP